MSEDEPPGLQNERTALAWSRTALSVLIAAAAIARLTLDKFGLGAVVSLGLTLTLALWIFWESAVRYRHVAELRIRKCNRDGVAGLSLTAMILILGFTELAALTKPQ